MMAVENDTINKETFKDKKFMRSGKFEHYFRKKTDTLSQTFKTVQLESNCAISRRTSNRQLDELLSHNPSKKTLYASIIGRFHNKLPSKTKVRNVLLHKALTRESHDSNI